MGARGLCALSISPRNKLSLVQYGAHSGLVAIICSTFAQHSSTCLSAATVRSLDDGPSSSALLTQAARLERRRQRQVYEVMRLTLKALLGISVRKPVPRRKPVPPPQFLSAFGGEDSPGAQNMSLSRPKISLHH